MCWKSSRWWPQHARHFHLYELTGNQLRPFPLLTQSILKISESVTRSKVSDQYLREQEAYGACKKFWTLVKPPNSCQFEILRPDLFFSLSLSLLLALLLSLLLSSTHPVCYFLVRSLCLSLSTWNLFCAPSPKTLLFMNFFWLVGTNSRVNPFRK
jgi:hypothetical protein